MFAIVARALTPFEGEQGNEAPRIVSTPKKGAKASSPEGPLTSPECRSVLRRHKNPRESGAPIGCATKSAPALAEAAVA